VTAAHYSLVYMNLFIDEFIVALDGRLDAQPANEIARRSQLPEAELSRRAWMLIRERLQSYWPVLE
jgi:5-bromo-4-chloroindolyl phosphate hydrolysis protein